MFVDCQQCPLRLVSSFRPLEGAELQSVRRMKIAQDQVLRKTDLITPQLDKAGVYTIFSGWGFRYVEIRKDSRQILDVLLPGDLVGLQGPMTGKVRHSVRALTDMSVCRLDEDAFAELFRRHPDLSEAIVATLLLEEHRADMRLMMLGRQRPTERLGYLLLELRDRLGRRGTDVSAGFRLPLTYEHFADLLGMSRSQVASSLTDLRRRGWALIADGVATLTGGEPMARACQYEGLGDPARRALI